MLFKRGWTEEQQRAAHETAKAVIRWLQVRREFERGDVLEQPVQGLMTDIYHSALIERLLAGKDPLPQPPPLSFGYPWHDLIDLGRGKPTEVHDGGRDVVWIDQFPWRVLRRRENGVLEVETDRAPGVWLLIPPWAIYEGTSAGKNGTFLDPYWLVRVEEESRTDLRMHT